MTKQFARCPLVRLGHYLIGSTLRLLKDLSVAVFLPRKRNALAQVQLLSRWILNFCVNRQAVLLSENSWKMGVGHGNLATVRTAYVEESEGLKMCKASQTCMTVSEISRLAIPQTGSSCWEVWWESVQIKACSFLRCWYRMRSHWLTLTRWCLQQE